MVNTLVVSGMGYLCKEQGISQVIDWSNEINGGGPRGFCYLL